MCSVPAISGFHDLHKLRLLVAEGEVVAAEFEFNRVAERGAADDFDADAVAEAHLEEPAAEFGVAADGHHLAAAADAELVQRARLGSRAAVTRDDPTCLLHTGSESGLRKRSVPACL